MIVSLAHPKSFSFGKYKTMSAPVEAFSALSPAAVGGRRRHMKLKLVTKKQARKMLKKLGKKLRGGADEPVVVAKDAPVAPAGGKRTRRRRHSSVSKGMFGL